MSKTKAEVATQALGELQMFGEGQSASSEDQKTAESRLVTMLARLRYDNIWNSQDDSEFEDEVVDLIAMLLAEELAPSIGRRPKNERSIKSLEVALLRIQNQPLSRNTMYVEPGLRVRRRGYFDFITGT